MAAAASPASVQRRPAVAFLEHADVFEDFYPHYGVTQEDFASTWHGSGNHAFVRLIQQEVADVTWYEFSLAPSLTEAQHGWTGCRVRFLRAPMLQRLLWRTYYVSRLAWRLQRYYRQYAMISSYASTLSVALLRALRRYRPDTIFCQDYATGRFDVLLVFARLLRLRLVAYHAGSTPTHYVGRLLRRRTLRHADMLLVSSRRELEWLAVEYRVPRERMVILPTPIDTDAFAPMARADACAQAGLDPARRYVLYAGRLDDRIKRVGMLLRCFAQLAARLEDVVLLIAGDGADRNALQDAAGTLAPDRVQFLGWRTAAAELAPLYNAAEVTVLISRSEGFPTVVGESLACGTPVIATDVGGIGELVEHGRTGWLLPATADEAVALSLQETLLNVLQPRAGMNVMRAAAREKALAVVSSTRVLPLLREALLGP